MPSRPVACSPLSQVLCGNYVNGGLDASTPVDSCNIYLTGSEVERLHQALMSGSTSNRRLQAQQRRLRETNCGACISNCYCTNVNNVSAQPSFLCVGCHESRENDVGAATPVRACIPTTRPTCPTRPRPSPQNCFPSDAQVDVEGVGALRMDQLHAGHKVLTMDASGRQAYEEVRRGRCGLASAPRRVMHPCGPCATCGHPPAAQLHPPAGPPPACPALLRCRWCSSVTATPPALPWCWR